MNATIKTTELSSLYPFRVNDGNKETLHPNRWSAAQKAATLMNSGYALEEITIERNVNGNWQDDTEAYPMAEKHLQARKDKQAQNGTSAKSASKEVVNFKTASRELAAALKLTGQAGDNATATHYQAVRERLDQMQSVLEEMGY